MEEIKTVLKTYVDKLPDGVTFDDLLAPKQEKVVSLEELVDFSKLEGLVESLKK